MQETKVVKLTQEWIAKRLPVRPKDANKGVFGKVLIIAGSTNYIGAPYLSAAAAYRIGAGLVTLVTEPEVKIIVSEKLPEVTFLSRNETVEKLNEYDVLLIGPGLGQSNETVNFVEQFLDVDLPSTVIDGDGLNIISKMDNWWERFWTSQNDKATDVILTPHPGEMSRLTGLSIDEIQKDRNNIAQKFAKKWKQVVVLKGAKTIIASPAGEAILSPFENPVLSTAGTGDVLSGVIAGLLAQGLNHVDAACVGVYIHGIAGEILREKIGDTGALASDLLPLLPQVLKKLA